MSDTPIFDQVANPNQEPPKEKTVEEQTPAWARKYTWFAKAIMSAVATFLLAFLTALIPYIDNGWHVSPIGWVTALVAGIAAGGASGGLVYITPNTKR